MDKNKKNKGIFLFKLKKKKLFNFDKSTTYNHRRQRGQSK